MLALYDGADEVPVVVDILVELRPGIVPHVVLGKCEMLLLLLHRCAKLSLPGVEGGEIGDAADLLELVSLERVVRYGGQFTPFCLILTSTDCPWAREEEDADMV